MDCPVCKEPMLVVEYRGIELDHCVECRGTWFDRDELELLMEQWLPEVEAVLPDDLESIAAAKADEDVRRCPLCRKKMRKIRLGRENPVLIDVCVLQEGMWFDSQEVTALAGELSRAAGAESSHALDFVGELFGGSRQSEREGQA